MQFLFETITVIAGKMSYYRIYNTGPDSYFAQRMEQEGDFALKRVEDDWIAELPGTNEQAEQIGEEVNRKERNLKNQS